MQTLIFSCCCKQTVFTVNNSCGSETIWMGKIYKNRKIKMFKIFKRKLCQNITISTISCAFHVKETNMLAKFPSNSLNSQFLFAPKDAS